MSLWLQGAAVLITALGLVCAVAAYRLTHAFRPAVAVLLDFLTAAGLIRLATDPAWDSIVLAAAVIALRKLISADLAFSRSTAA